MRRHFRPSKTNSSLSAENNVLEENVRIEVIDIEPNMIVDSNKEQATSYCKEYHDHPESIHEYLEN